MRGSLFLLSYLVGTGDGALLDGQEPTGDLLSLFWSWFVGGTVRDVLAYCSGLGVSFRASAACFSRQFVWRLSDGRLYSADVKWLV